MLKLFHDMYSGRREESVKGTETGGERKVNERLRRERSGERAWQHKEWRKKEWEKD